MRRVVRLALLGVFVGIAALGLKYAAYLVTGSVALYSDALESIINVATALAAFFAVRLSAVPPDANHPYGHDKAEYLSAVLEGALIVVAALAIMRKAYL
ncbi:MAG: cation transporter, partial [Acidobacteria bacterium]|nr:cation transporter [Acidobacteriota bacterium]